MVFCSFRACVLEIVVSALCDASGIPADDVPKGHAQRSSRFAEGNQVRGTVSGQAGGGQGVQPEGAEKSELSSGRNET